MKLLKSIVITLTALAALGGFTACQDDFDTPELLVQPPKADIEPNTTILDLKKLSGATPRATMPLSSATRRTVSTT